MNIGVTNLPPLILADAAKLIAVKKVNTVALLTLCAASSWPQSRNIFNLTSRVEYIIISFQEDILLEGDVRYDPV